jgi:hypothetical protein
VPYIYEFSLNSYFINVHLRWISIVLLTHNLSRSVFRYSKCNSSSVSQADIRLSQQTMRRAEHYVSIMALLVFSLAFDLINQFRALNKNLEASYFRDEKCGWTDRQIQALHTDLHEVYSFYRPLSNNANQIIIK